MRVRRRTVLERIAEQERWISEHGGSEAGYIARYGSRDDAKHYGDGGEAIWRADFAELQRLRALVRVRKEVKRN